MQQPFATIGPYRIVSELGRGGMGVVYEVADPQLPGRRLALKQILKDMCGPEALRRFAREAELLARIQHPNVVQVYACTLDPVAYLVTELVEGRDLQGLCGREEVSAERACEITAQISDAVAALHGAGIIHRDLKPENVILRPDGTPVLLDFGLARELDGDGLTRTGEVLGTPAYMSPEQADAAKDIDERTDVYGLGAILFQLVAGRAPFQAESMVRLLYKVLQEEPDWGALRKRDVPPPLLAIIQRALEKERDDRYPSAQALAADLRRFLAGEAVLAQPRRSNKGPLVAGLVLLLGAAGVGAAVFASQNSASGSPTPTPTPSAMPTASSRPVDELAGITSLGFRKLPGKDQLRLIEPFMARLDANQWEVALENLRGKPLWEAGVFDKLKQNTGQLERGALFLPDDLVVTWIGSSQLLVCLSADDGKRLWELKLPHVVNACALAPGKKSILAFENPAQARRLVAGPEGWRVKPSIEVYSLGQNPAAYRLKPVKCAAFSPDGQRLVIGLGARTREKRAGSLLVDQLKASPPRVRQLGTSPQSGNAMVCDIAWSRDSQRVYTGGEGVRAGEIATFGYDLSGADPRVHFIAPTGLAGSMTTFALCLVGEDLIQAQKNGFVRRFIGIAKLGTKVAPDAYRSFVRSSDSPLTQTHQSMVSGVLANDEGDWVYSIGGPFEKVDNPPPREICVWHRASPEAPFELAAEAVEVPSSPRRSYLSGDGKRLLLVCMDGRLRCYDTWLLRQKPRQ